MSVPVIIFNRDLDLLCPAQAVGTGLAPVALLRVKGAKGLMRIDGTVGPGGALNALQLAGCGVQDTTPQVFASSQATPNSDFANATDRKPNNSASPETTAANGMFWIDVLVDGLSDIVILAAAAAATTLALNAHITERGRIG